MKVSHVKNYPTKHFIDNYELSKEEIQDILSTIVQLKEAAHQNAIPQLLKGATLAMIFEEPSTRTRVSFETAMAELGGHGLYLKPGEIHFGSHEAIKDTAKVLSSMCDGIMLRTEEHELVLNLAEHATVPVFNAMTYYIHPTQGLADVLTMMEHLPEGKTLEDSQIVFVGDSGENGIMAMEHAHLAASLGLKYTIASPKKYTISQAEIDKVNKKMALTGGTLTVTEEVEEAVNRRTLLSLMFGIIMVMRTKKKNAQQLLSALSIEYGDAEYRSGALQSAALLAGKSRGGDYQRGLGSSHSFTGFPRSRKSSPRSKRLAGMVLVSSVKAGK